MRIRLSDCLVKCVLSPLTLRNFCIEPLGIQCYSGELYNVREVNDIVVNLSQYFPIPTITHPLIISKPPMGVVGPRSFFGPMNCQVDIVGNMCGCVIHQRTIAIAITHRCLGREGRCFQRIAPYRAP